MFNGAAVHRVTRAQAAIGIYQELRHQEQRDALGPGRCVRQFGQHQVDDVFGEVVLATGDEDLGAADLVGAVRLRLGLGADHPQVCTGMGFRQAHGTGPLTRIHLRQVGGLEFFTGVGVDRYTGTGGQHRVQAESQARRVDHLFNLRRHRLGHAHAAVGRVAAHAYPAAFGVGAVGLGKTVGSGHGAVRPVAALLIAAAAERGNGFGGDLAGLFQDRFDGFGVNAVCQCR